MSSSPDGPARSGASGLQIAGFGVCLVAAAVSVWTAAHSSFFYADDYANFWLARTEGTTLAFLKTPYFQHFAPGHRILDELVLPAGRPSWTVAEGVLMAWYVLAVAAFHWLARQLADKAWLALVTTVMVAASPVWVRLLQWFASGAHVAPAIGCSMVFLAAGWAWLEERRPYAFVLAIGALATGLLFYERPVLAVGVLALTRYGVRAPSLRPAAVLRRVAGDWPLWVAVVAIGVAYYAVLRSGGYVPQSPNASAVAWRQYLRLSWSRGTTPLLVLQNVPQAATSLNNAVVVVAQVALAALVGLSLVLYRWAWRAWVAYGIQWWAYVLVIGVGRLGQFGPSIGYDLRYMAEFAVLLPLTLVLAFSGPPRQGRVATLLRGRRGALPRSARLAAPVIVGALVVASGAQSGRRVGHAWPGAAAGRYMGTFERSLAMLRQRGIEPTLVDGQSPGALDPGHLPPTSTIGTLMRAFDPSVSVGAPNRPRYILRDDGSLVPAG